MALRFGKVITCAQVHLEKDLAISYTPLLPECMVEDGQSFVLRPPLLVIAFGCGLAARLRLVYSRQQIASPHNLDLLVGKILFVWRWFLDVFRKDNGHVTSVLTDCTKGCDRFFDEVHVFLGGVDCNHEGTFALQSGCCALALTAAGARPVSINCCCRCDFGSLGNALEKIK